MICCGVLSAGLLSACVELPSQPTVAVMPAPYKPMEVFQGDDVTCRGYAQHQVSVDSGGNTGYQSEGYLQYRYNLTYEQCMYSKGNQVSNFSAPASVPPPPGMPPATAGMPPAPPSPPMAPPPPPHS
jgi:hypothetical protein